MDLTRIPTKEGTRFGVLDGHGRITIIDEVGGIAGVIQAPADDQIIPGVGGEGHLMLLQGDRLAMVWGNEGWVYSLEGEQLSHFELEDGSPTGSVALKNKMGLIYGKKLVMYSQDGFRHGDVMEGALGDGHAMGSEEALHPLRRGRVDLSPGARRLGRPCARGERPCFA